MIRAVVLAALALTVCITGSSAFLRHQQSGLGCTPWPACYAATAEPGAAPAASDAVTVARAIHRVTAGLVGLLVLALVFIGWSALAGSGERVAAALALAVTLGLAWLGLHTPHVLPIVTQGNVLGGFTLAGAFAWLAARPAARGVEPADRSGRLLAASALAVLALQTASGTLVSVRHAVAACGVLDCGDVGTLGWRSLDLLQAGAGGAESPMLHRALAIASGLTALAAARHAPRGIAIGIVVAVAAQLASGFATATGAAPLLTATAHNLGGACLVALLAITLRTARRPSPDAHRLVPT